jgi:hypothetical protein
MYEHTGMSVDIIVYKSIYQETNLYSPNGFAIDDLVHFILICNLCVAGYCYIAYMVKIILFFVIVS